MSQKTISSVSRVDQTDTLELPELMLQCRWEIDQEIRELRGKKQTSEKAISQAVGGKLNRYAGY